jgi:uncharacterized membrane protein YedE/YeeE
MCRSRSPKVVLALTLVVTLAAVRRPAHAEEPRSEGVATLLAIGGTATPGLIAWWMSRLPRHAPRAAWIGGGVALVAGVEIGPSLGHWYAGDYWTRGMAVRTGASLPC